MDLERRYARQLQAMQAVCGQPELVSADVPEGVSTLGEISTPEPSAASQGLSLLWPSDGQRLLVYKAAEAGADGGARTLVQVAGMEPWWAPANAAFELPPSVAPESLFRGVLYMDKAGDERVGLYDCVWYEGDREFAHGSALQRHAHVAGLFHGVSQASRVGHHWAGEAAACEGLLRPEAQGGLPFAAGRVEVML